MSVDFYQAMGMVSMGKSLSTMLLAIGALIMVGAGVFFIAATALGDDNDSPAAAESGEQHVYLLNLGMT
jgi:hypothetical protein